MCHGEGYCGMTVCAVNAWLRTFRRQLASVACAFAVLHKCSAILSLTGLSNVMLRNIANVAAKNVPVRLWPSALYHQLAMHLAS